MSIQQHSLISGLQEYKPAIEYVAARFHNLNKNPLKTVYVHETCATDTRQIDKILDSCIDVIIAMNLGAMGMQ